MGSEDNKRAFLLLKKYTDRVGKLSGIFEIQPLNKNSSSNNTFLSVPEVTLDIFLNVCKKLSLFVHLDNDCQFIHWI